MTSTKDKIFDAAELLFAECGIDGASLRAITNKAGVNLGSIHYYFGSKTNLLKELIKAKVGEFSEEKINELNEFIKSGERNFKKLWLIHARGSLKMGAEKPNMLRIAGHLVWSPKNEYREFLSTMASEFEEAFVREVLSYLPKDCIREAERRCRIMMSMIFMTSIDAYRFHLTMHRLRLKIKPDELANEMAEIASSAMQKFMPGNA